MPSNKNIEALEGAFKYYMKDFPLTQEDLQKSLLDVGTGTGEFIKYMRDVLGNKNVIGVDYQRHKIDPNYEGLIVANGMDLPFEEESFDNVIAHNYLPMFVSDPIKMQRAIEESLRVVKKKGKVMGDIHTPESVVICNDELRQNLGKDYTERDEELFKQQYKGAEKLQEYLEGLDQDRYVVELIGNLNKRVLVITKL